MTASRAMAELTEIRMETEARPPTWKILLAFSMIYFVWGSTFWRSAWGLTKFLHSCWRRSAFLRQASSSTPGCGSRAPSRPSRREWVSATALGALIFVFDYGCLFWAEQRVPSGVTAVVLASIPVFIALLEIIFLRTQKLTVRLGLCSARRDFRRSGVGEPFVFSGRGSH